MKILYMKFFFYYCQKMKWINDIIIGKKYFLIILSMLDKKKYLIRVIMILWVELFHELEKKCFSAIFWIFFNLIFYWLVNEKVYLKNFNYFYNKRFNQLIRYSLSVLMIILNEIASKCVILF